MTETQTLPAPAAEPKLTDHAYDGIQEFDNPTPGWWTWLFILTVVFSAVYFLFVTMTGDQLCPVGFYKRALEAEDARQFASMGKLSPDRETLLASLSDPKRLSVGKGLFVANCASCHGQDGQGTLSAPNLTDNTYIHVSKIEDILDVVTKGRVAQGMPVRGGANLNTNQIVVISSYVASLRGTNAAGGMPPKGDRKVTSWTDQ